MRKSGDFYVAIDICSRFDYCAGLSHEEIAQQGHAQKALAVEELEVERPAGFVVIQVSPLVGPWRAPRGGAVVSTRDP